jgi:hypothetical protein
MENDFIFLLKYFIIYVGNMLSKIISWNFLSPLQKHLCQLSSIRDSTLQDRTYIRAANGQVWNHQDISSSPAVEVDRQQISQRCLNAESHYCIITQVSSGAIEPVQLSALTAVLHFNFFWLELEYFRVVSPGKSVHTLHGWNKRTAR